MKNWIPVRGSRTKHGLHGFTIGKTRLERAVLTLIFPLFFRLFFFFNLFLRFPEITLWDLMYRHHQRNLKFLFFCSLFYHNWRMTLSTPGHHQPDITVKKNAHSNLHVQSDTSQPERRGRQGQIDKSPVDYDIISNVKYRPFCWPYKDTV